MSQPTCPHAEMLSHASVLEAYTKQAVQDEEDQWMIVDRDGRQEQQGRWAPAKIVRHMMSRARRHRAESPFSMAAFLHVWFVQTHLADTASASHSAAPGPRWPSSQSVFLAGWPRPLGRLCHGRRVSFFS